MSGKHETTKGTEPKAKTTTGTHASTSQPPTPLKETEPKNKTTTANSTPTPAKHTEPNTKVTTNTTAGVPLKKPEKTELPESSPNDSSQQRNKVIQRVLKEKESPTNLPKTNSKTKAVSGSPDPPVPTERKRRSSKVQFHPEGDHPLSEEDNLSDNLHVTSSDLRRVVTRRRRSIRRTRAKSALPAIFTAVDAIYLMVRLGLFFYYDASRLFGDEDLTQDPSINKTVIQDYCGHVYQAVAITWFSMFTWLFYLIGTILLVISIAKLASLLRLHHHENHKFDNSCRRAGRPWAKLSIQKVLHRPWSLLLCPPTDPDSWGEACPSIREVNDEIIRKL